MGEKIQARVIAKDFPLGVRAIASLSSDTTAEADYLALGVREVRELHGALSVRRRPLVWKLSRICDGPAPETLRIPQRFLAVVDFDEYGHMPGTSLAWTDPAGDPMRGPVCRLPPKQT